MIDVLIEDLLDLPAACKERPFRRMGKPCSLASLYRYVLRGSRAADGQRIRLETVRGPTGLRTSREAIVRFFAALTDPAALPAPTEARREKQKAAAEAELVAAGFEIQ